MKTLLAFFAPLVIYAVILALHILLPARTVDGYVVDTATGKPFRYRLNGLRTFFVVVGLFASLCTLGWLPWDYFFVHRWEMAGGACLMGLIFSAAIVFMAPRRGRSALSDFYLGRLENPQWTAVRADAKLCLYLIGAILLELNVLSFAAHHFVRYPSDPSPGVFLYVALFTFFIVEYLCFEQVHLYTYDFFAERVGFKLGWGCLVFYPFFYAVGLWTLANKPNPHTPAALLAAYGAIFFAGWMLSRGANLQKFYFKTQPDKKVFGLLTPVKLEANGKQILCSGFWGLSRHINYLGEILMATGLALSLGYPWAIGPWLYPLYYVGLLLPRQSQDDKRCAQKYGALWDEYRRRVPYRIIPWIY